MVRKQVLYPSERLTSQSYAKVLGQVLKVFSYSLQFLILEQTNLKQLETQLCLNLELKTRCYDLMLVQQKQLTTTIHNED